MKRHFSPAGIFFLSFVLAALLLNAPERAFAQSVTYGTNSWEDRSDELPGMVSTETLVLVAVGTAAVVGAIWYASKNKRQDRKDDNQEDAGQSPSSTKTSDAETSLQLDAAAVGWQDRLADAQHAVPFNLSVGMQRPGLISTERGVVVRLSVNL